MRKMLGIVAVLAWASTSYGQYTGAFDHNWDFNDGSLQGWTKVGASGGSEGTRVFLPDGTYMWLDTEALGYNGVTKPKLGGATGMNRYILQVDVTIPAANYLQDSGIGAYRGTLVSGNPSSDWKGPSIQGYNGGNGGAGVVDKSWDNINHSRNFYLQPNPLPNFGAGETVKVTLQLDYGYTVANKFKGWGYMYDFPNQRGAAANTWFVIDGGSNTYDVHPGDNQRFLRVGGVGTPVAGGAWTQARFDNVRLKVLDAVPEPTTVGLLTIGGLFLARRRRTA